MKKIVLSDTVKKLGRTLNKNSPAILTGFGVFGVVTTTIMGITATPKALLLLKDAELNIEGANGLPIRPLNSVEKAKVLIPIYMPTIAMGGLTIYAILSANKINATRVAALTSILTLAERNLQEYQHKVLAKLGEKKEAVIRSEILQDHISKNPPKDNAIIITGKGDHLCFDDLSGRYFTSDIETIRKIQNDFNKRLLNEMTLPINELYFELGLESIPLGDNMGWSVEKKMLELTFTAKLTPDGRSCIVLTHSNPPQAL
jgi:hypothetical protein